MAGRVTDAVTGEPVRKATLKLVPFGAVNVTSNQPADPFVGVPLQRTSYEATSDSNGIFHYENLGPGRYMLSGERFGFLPTSYGSRLFATSTSIITLASEQHLADISLSLRPQAVISGKVLDDDGDPVIPTNVQILAQTWMAGKLRFVPKSSCEINDLGEFRCAHLAPGKYYVSAQPSINPSEVQVLSATAKSKSRQVRTYYPSGPSMASATPIEVTAGQEAAGTNIRILTSQPFHVRGKVFTAPGNLQSSLVTLVDRDGEGLQLGGQSNLGADGTFDIPTSRQELMRSPS